MERLHKIKILILGSTGSIGTQTLEVISGHIDKFQVFGLACNSNEKLLKIQAKRFKVPMSRICLSSGNQKKIYEFIKDKNVDVVVNAISGAAGLRPAIETLKAGKILALANKESVVLDGANLKKLKKKYTQKGAKILPLDSEHHAILRLLEAENMRTFDPKKVRKITITASGGPFFGCTKKQLEKVTPKDALNHPNWKMGAKITIESATLLNKGYEIIEAHHLFSAPLKNLDAIIDRKSFVHAIIEFKSPKKTLAIAYKPDMKIVIEDTLLKLYHGKYAKNTNRKFVNKKIKILDGEAISKYKFDPIDHKTFPAIKNIIKEFKAGRIHGFYKRKEEMIGRFLAGEIAFHELL